MPVEIRKLIIKASVDTALSDHKKTNEVDISQLKKEVLAECERRMIKLVKKKERIR